MLHGVSSGLAERAILAGRIALLLAGLSVAFGIIRHGETLEIRFSGSLPVPGRQVNFAFGK
jgi:hypothetical protein